MCIHEFNLSTACGHHFPKQPPSAKPNVFFEDYSPTIAVPQSLTCVPVKLALKFYHDQVVYRPTEQDYGAKVEIPKSCPIVHRPRDGPTRRAIREHEKARNLLDKAMFANGLGPRQQKQIETDAAVLDRCSNRAKPGAHSPVALQQHRERRYPQNMYAHVQSVHAFQARNKRSMAPNVRYTNVDFGCGGPFSAECLTGWDGERLLTHRLHLWGDTITHPKRCTHECLAGWSGAHLNEYRQQTWTGGTSDGFKHWNMEHYCKWSPSYTFKEIERSERSEPWAVIDYSNISHLHAEQYRWDGTRFVRIHKLPNGHVVHVPETVDVPVPERLDQVLHAMIRMRLVSPPGPPPSDEADQASIKNVLRQLPEAFNEEVPSSGKGPGPLVIFSAEGSENASTSVNEPLREPEPMPVETPEMAHARRQRARELLREKLRRNFPGGAEKMKDRQG